MMFNKIKNYCQYLIQVTMKTIMKDGVEIIQSAAMIGI